jgi:hypothetical protein
MKEILVVEPLCSNNEHLSFNFDLIQTLAEKYDISFCGNSEYIDNLEKTNLEFKKTYSLLYHKYSIKELFKRYIHIWKILLKNRKNNSIILFSSFDNTLFSIFCILYFFIGGFKLRKRIVLVCHNNLYTLKKNYTKRFFFKISCILYKIRIIVLTEKMFSISKNILSDNTFLYRHPYYKKDIQEVKNNSICKLLLVGRQANYAVQSGFIYDIINILNDIKKENLDWQVELHIGSEIYGEVDSIFPVFKYPLIDNNTYTRLFNEASFILFPYNINDFYRASGVLMDAISYNTSFIAPRDGHFKEYGDCGFLYSNLSELSIIFNNLVNNNCSGFKQAIINKKKEIDTNKKKLFEII